MAEHRRSGGSDRRVFDPSRGPLVTEAQRATARANLAAICCTRHGVDPAHPDRSAAILAAQEFATLAQILGLDPPPAQPRARRVHRAATPTPDGAERAARVVELRKQGLLFREIGRAVGLSDSAVQVIYHAEMDRQAEQEAAS